LTVGYYAKYLGRSAKEGEITGWVNQLRHGCSEEEVKRAFVSSHEYYGRAGGTNKRWLNRVFQDLLGRNPDRTAQRFEMGLNQGAETRALVAAAIMASAEYRRIQLPNMAGTVSPDCSDSAA
jgi:hypothetical protein